MIRGIKKETIIKNFKEDDNNLEFAREYGVNEVIDGHLYFTYEGKFSDDEIDNIIELLEKNL